MKKFLSVFLSASFAFCPLFSGFFASNRVKAAAEIPVYAEFEENSVIATIDYNASRVRLYSAEPTLEELGIIDVKQLNINSQSEISAFSVYTEPLVCELTLVEPGRENVLETVKKLNSLSYIREAQPNYIYTAYSDDTFVPNDTYYGSTDPEKNQLGLQAVDPERAWNFMNKNNIDCSDVVVGIIDSGINFSHEDLIGNIWTNPDEIAGDGIDNDGNKLIDDVNGWDFVTEDNNPTDENGHGSNVCGIVSAVTNNAKGIASLSRTAKIMPLRILDAQGSGNTAKFTAAIYYAANKGVKIINGSLGGFEVDSALKTAIDENSDVLFVFAAGNFRFNNDSLGKEERTFKTSTGEKVVKTVSRSYPASYDNTNIISVAASGTVDGNYDTIASFSNFGVTSVDIAAPGVSIYSADKGSSNAYAPKNGTSQAAPLVASAAATVKAAYPQLTPEEIIEILMNSSDKTASLKDKVKSGGRLNAYKALLATIPTPSPTVEPTAKPTAAPTALPTAEPTAEPTMSPTLAPTAEPTEKPTAEPTFEPTLEPTISPTAEPTASPTTEPTVRPIPVPTFWPTAAPTVEPTPGPTTKPTAEPTASPTVEPTAIPTIEPMPKQTVSPTTEPTVRPIPVPTSEPTASPTAEPTAKPTIEPTLSPTAGPTIIPTSAPAAYSIKYKNGGAVVTSPKEGTYCVVFAVYENGALTAVKTAEAVFAGAGELTVMPADFNTDNADSVKVMLWETLYGMRPLCKSDKNK